jgi:quercetin dioxygenase-like cupin family protein
MEAREPRVEKVADLVGYQDGSVVSRKLVSAGGGNITLFAFAAGEGLSEHTTPFTAWVQVIEGEARISIDGTQHTVATGEVLLLPASRPHALHAEQRFKMLLTMIRA